MFSFLVLTTLLCFSNADEAIHHIQNEKDFSDFLNNVNVIGTNYSGTTILIDSDLSLSDITEPIGVYNSYSDYNPFLGTFDGQGHIISNFRVTNSSLYLGLFVYTTGITIRNIVLDSTCSLTSDFSSSYSGLVNIGGIIGYCFSRTGPCVIDNVVNMASVTFSGYFKKGSFSLGGIVGHFATNNYNISVSNCANYGNVLNSGTSEGAYLGGIIGMTSTGQIKHIQNCVNYGTVTHGGSTKKIVIGGFAGYIQTAQYENCLNAGKIVHESTLSTEVTVNETGGFAGCIGSYSYIYHCYYADTLNEYNMSGSGTASDISNTPDTPTSVDATLISTLNTQASINGYNKWLLATNNAVVSFKVNDNPNPISLSSQALILPTLTSDWRKFAWYSDSTYETPFNLSAVSVSTTLYGRWITFILTLDPNGGEVSYNTKYVDYGSPYGELPIPTKDGNIFNGWHTEPVGGLSIKSYTRVSSDFNHAIYAHWSGIKDKHQYTLDNDTEVEIIETDDGIFIGPIDLEKEGYEFVEWYMDPTENIIKPLWRPCNYTVLFDVNGGEELAGEEGSMVVTFNSAYGELPIPTREGYVFTHWVNEKNESVTSESAVSVASGHTLYAQWAVPSTYVEVVFGSKDLSGDEVRTIIKHYTDADFSIGRFEKGDSVVVIKFNDEGDAVTFVRKVKGSSKAAADGILEVNFVNEESYISFSPVACLVSFGYLLLNL